MRVTRVVRTAIPCLAILALAALAACAPSDDPIDIFNGYCDEVIRILKEPAADAKLQLQKIEDFWKSKQLEIERIRRQLEEEISAAAGRPEREAFVNRFDRCVERLREINALLRERGIEL